MKKRHILIIDDNKKMLERRAVLLREKGYDVLCGPNGKKGMKLLRNNRDVDLVIIDLDIPRIGRDKLLETIKKYPEFLSIKILVITGMEESYYMKRQGTLWGYESDPIVRIEVLGQIRRGWDEKFRLIRKWNTYDVSDRKFLEAVEEMFIEPTEIDRPREQGEKWHILILDDDKIMKEGIKKILNKKYNYEIIKAKDRETALNILSRGEVDLVILYLESHYQGGEDVLDILGSNFILSNIPVIIWTSIKKWDMSEYESIRRKVEKMNIVEIVYDREEEWAEGAIFRLGAPFILLSKVDALLRKRQRWGYGYLKEPLTFFRDKKGRWMPGALEYYQPVDPYLYEDRKRDQFFCSCCMQEKLIGDSFNQICEYNKERLFPSAKSSITTREAILICSECTKEITQKYTNLGKYALRYNEISCRREREKEEIKKRIKKPSKIPMNQEIFKKTVSIIKEVLFDAELVKIRPESNIEKDIVRNTAIYNYFMTDMRLSIELEYDIEISDNDADWFDTVQDVVDYIDEELSNNRLSSHETDIFLPDC